jgi:hypothetical protein
MYHATTRHSHTFRGGPTANLACEVHADDLGALKFPRNTGHDIDSIRTTNTTRDHSQTTSIGRMRVGADHETTREGVVFKDNLMDDTRARFPESKTVLRNAVSQTCVEVMKK